MAQISIKAKNEYEIDKKPRVYFTCHPEEFTNYFERIYKDLWKSHDCAVYYTPDMTEAFEEEYLETDLGRNNLFVVPVTLRLLTEPNRAMDKDIPYALQNHIPLLPIMMEPGLDVVYSRPDKFGELQYLSPNGVDDTQISYENKLEKYLDEVLISKELAQRIRSAFDCYIFLSYRKKDRRYANELMKLIHANPECRDVAIWFDEFLTPGESFKESIDRILHDSKLFALLVTPNLLEMPNGEPNFVMGQEYPAAQQAGLEILPAEMVSTDQLLLNEQFQGLPDCVNPHDAVFQERLVEAVRKLAIPTNNTPEHNYLVGLAYMDGIDVEMNREYALELITSAAEAGYPEAMNKLWWMYREGVYTYVDYEEAVKWGEKYTDYMVTQYGYESEMAVASANNLAFNYRLLGDYLKAAELHQKIYDSQYNVLGAEHPTTLYILRCLIYEITWLVRGQVANAPCKAVSDEKMGEWKSKFYDLCCKILDEDTLRQLNSQASSDDTDEVDLRKRALYQKIYDVCCENLGEEHPDTLYALSDLSECTGFDFQKRFELKQKAYDLYCKVFGEEHPDTLYALCTLAYYYDRWCDRHKALELYQKAYDSYCKVLGEKHLDTVDVLACLVNVCGKLGDDNHQLELQKKMYAQCCEVYGEEHDKTSLEAFLLTNLHEKRGEYEEALVLKEKRYAIDCKRWGERDTIAMSTLADLALCYMDAGRLQKALQLYEKLLTQRTEMLGIDDPSTQETLSRLEEVRAKLQAVAND